MLGKKLNCIIIIIIIIIMCQIRCKNKTDENLNNTDCIDMNEIIHKGMDKVSFLMLIQKTNWIPGKISGIYLQKDTIQISGTSICVRKERYFYSRKKNGIVESLIVEFYRIDNDFCCLNKYVFTSDDVNIRNVDSILDN
ncbi:MAG: hypothetical protein GX639_05460 [Fibrobacter sp.]|nr:hypothetical protein [Fibrobacter sp.]